MATQQEQQSVDILLECPITKTRFIDPVIAEDGHTYERQAIEKWLSKQQISPLTRERMSVSSLRPNRVVKQLLDLEKKAEKQNYKFKLNIDVKKKRNCALFRNGDKFIYEAEWLNNLQGPEVIILHIRSVRASKEASFYVDLSRHPNIVRTFGIVEPANEQDLGVMLLQEYAPLGDLSELLENESTLPNNLQIFYEIFLQIIDAMTYLVKKNIVHGDLACRNVLVFNFSRSSSKDILVKLTDFGLTRTSTIYQTTNYSRSTTNIVPFRSSAPEVLQSPNNRESYTEKSDIFSMGVLMWECLSKGNIPWIDFSEEQIKKKVLHGERLKRPTNGPCSDQLWSIILMCMAHRPQDRPTFVQLDRLISDLFPSRTPTRTRHAQYTSLQYAASQSVIVSAVQNNELQEVTVSPLQEKLIQIDGPLLLDDSGREAGYLGDGLKQFEVGGSNSYSSGVHRIEMEFSVSNFVEIDFFGVISGNSKYQKPLTYTTGQPCAYGWSRYNIYRKGKSDHHQGDIRIRSGSHVLELTLDCVHRKIICRINHTDYRLPVKDILIDTEACPFPLQWRFRFAANKWALRLVSK